MSGSGFPVSGWLQLASWGGRSSTLVDIVGQTPKRYRIRAIERMRLAGRHRWLKRGETALVPKTAVSRIRFGPAAEVTPLRE